MARLQFGNTSYSVSRIQVIYEHMFSNNINDSQFEILLIVIHCNKIYISNVINKNLNKSQLYFTYIKKSKYVRRPQNFKS